MRLRIRPICLLALLLLLPCLEIQADEPRFPPASDLESQPAFPDPLVFFNGQRVTSPEEWNEKRRPELKALFQHYMYGVLPPAPQRIEFEVQRVNPDYFGGRATKKEISIRFGGAGVPTIELLMVIPNKRTGPAPVFLGINFCGNHTLVDDPSIAISPHWMRASCPGCENNRATDAGRGKQADVWNLEQSIDRGYAVATFYDGDLDPDKDDFTDGVHPHYAKQGQAGRGPQDWATIAAWAWGAHRAVDYLHQDKDIDTTRIALVGHSRLGKTALLAGALDERIDLVIPHQAGCGGTAPDRHKVGETVKAINDRFPHWFCDEFKKFNDREEYLPFDQHALIALCAPRPVLVSNAIEDTWADPDGQFHMVELASPVYRFLGVEGLAEGAKPEPGKLISSRLGYYLRPGKHSMTKQDWQAFLDYADSQFKK